MIDDILTDAETRMEKSIEVLKQDLAKIKTGRAHPDLLAHVTISYYGSDTPLNQIANVNILDARTLGVTPWEKGIIGQVEKAIMSSDLGLNPVNLGDTLRIPLPPLTEERRREMTKLVRNEAEKGRIAIRNVRRDANSMIKDLLKEKELTEDQARNAEESVQKITDKLVSEVDKLTEAKEKDLMSI
ncbi:ribosome recycling factor [Thiotrichales bacterium 19S11-10]|nr:ribosome recycling factor [Thiotrichales bacterium 19S11-10]MCF6807312.1 ribosome recycling factor [Thiotrichales bacterium 19S9-11]MCF6811281.1 ribosome recycling factor [Thiotrichales bacterium 19S9-12]